MATIKKPRVYATAYGRYQFVREGSIDRFGGRRITSSILGCEIARDYFRDVHGETFQERFCVLTVDTKNVPIAWYQITVGTLDASLVHPREVFKPAILDSAAAIIIAHNHPSGDPTPSREDISVTDRLTEVGKLIGIGVLDHIVIGDGTWRALSIREC
jgi:DNA repair protein RadC